MDRFAVQGPFHGATAGRGGAGLGRAIVRWVAWVVPAIAWAGHAGPAMASGAPGADGSLPQGTVFIGASQTPLHPRNVPFEFEGDRGLYGVPEGTPPSVGMFFLLAREAFELPGQVVNRPACAQRIVIEPPRPAAGEPWTARMTFVPLADRDPECRRLHLEEGAFEARGAGIPPVDPRGWWRMLWQHPPARIALRLDDRRNPSVFTSGRVAFELTGPASGSVEIADLVIYEPSGLFARTYTGRLDFDPGHYVGAMHYGLALIAERGDTTTPANLAGLVERLRDGTRGGQYWARFDLRYDDRCPDGPAAGFVEVTDRVRAVTFEFGTETPCGVVKRLPDGTVVAAHLDFPNGPDPVVRFRTRAH